MNERGINNWPSGFDKMKIPGDLDPTASVRSQGGKPARVGLKKKKKKRVRLQEGREKNVNSYLWEHTLKI